MRCPRCGTENAPDSRFCGGCGARFGPGGPRVAATAKIPDDAPLAPPTRPVSAPIPHSYGPAAMPPPVVPTPPPGALGQPPELGSMATTSPRRAVATQQPLTAPASASFAAPAHRPLGLIALVLIADLGLAIAGAVLLAKGLAKSDAKPAPEQKLEQKNP